MSARSRSVPCGTIGIMTISNNHSHGRLWGRVGAEFVGSFLVLFLVYVLTSIVTALYSVNILLIAVGTAFAYATVTAVFSYHGTVQLNPAVTVASVVSGRTRLPDGVLYVIAQVVASVLAAFAVKPLLPVNKNIGPSTWLSSAVNGYGDASVSASTLKGADLSFGLGHAAVFEFVAALLVIACVLRFSVMGARSAGIIGAAYGAGTLFAYPVTGAALNPARATGIAVLGHAEQLPNDPLGQLWVFWLFPVLAAAIVAVVLLAGEAIGMRAAIKATEAREAMEAVPGEEHGTEADDGAEEAAEDGDGPEGTGPTDEADDAEADGPEPTAEDGHGTSDEETGTAGDAPTPARNDDATAKDADDTTADDVGNATAKDGAPSGKADDEAKPIDDKDKDGEAEPAK